jgi:hypothetical protein
MAVEAARSGGAVAWNTRHKITFGNTPLYTRKTLSSP